MTRTLLSIGLASMLLGCGKAPPPRPRPTPSPAGAIPISLQGRYALTPATCHLLAGATRMQAAGLLTIGPDAIAFGVEQQSVDSIAIRADRVVIDTTRPADGGATESRRYSFRTVPDGRRLTRTEFNLPDQVYTRCPTQPN